MKLKINKWNIALNTLNTLRKQAPSFFLSCPDFQKHTETSSSVRFGWYLEVTTVLQRQAVLWCWPKEEMHSFIPFLLEPNKADIQWCIIQGHLVEPHMATQLALVVGVTPGCSWCVRILGSSHFKHYGSWIHSPGVCHATQCLPTRFPLSPLF